jgi:hypothetical protein
MFLFGIAISAAFCIANSSDLAAESNCDSVVKFWNFSASSVYSPNIDSLNFS